MIFEKPFLDHGRAMLEVRKWDFDQRKSLGKCCSCKTDPRMSLSGKRKSPPAWKIPSLGRRIMIMIK
jgi:hypothetical protein